MAWLIKPSDEDIIDLVMKVAKVITDYTHDALPDRSTIKTNDGYCTVEVSRLKIVVAKRGLTIRSGSMFSLNLEGFELTDDHKQRIQTFMDSQPLLPRRRKR